MLKAMACQKFHAIDIFQLVDIMSNEGSKKWSSGKNPVSIVHFSDTSSIPLILKTPRCKKVRFFITQYPLHIWQIVLQNDKLYSEIHEIYLCLWYAIDMFLAFPNKQQHDIAPRLVWYIWCLDATKFKHMGTDMHIVLTCCFRPSESLIL